MLDKSYQMFTNETLHIIIYIPPEVVIRFFWEYAFPINPLPSSHKWCIHRIYNIVVDKFFNKKWKFMVAAL